MHVNALIYLCFYIMRSAPKVEPHGPAVKACPLEAKNGPTKIIALPEPMPVPSGPWHS
jgi:hypothetical protein